MKRPKRKVTNKGQYFLFEEMILSANKSKKPIIETHNNLLTKYYYPVQKFLIFLIK